MRLKNINRRKLNNKGFTLIELLAVVVILAIVMGIAATSVLSSINNSRKSSLVSTAQNLANTLNTWVSEDMVQTDDALKKLGDGFMETENDAPSNGKWHCLGADIVIKNGGKNAKLSTALSISDKELILTGTAPTVVIPTGQTTGKTAVPTVTSASPTCSAFRYNETTGAFEVLLVAKKGGKYWVSNNGGDGRSNFAFSRASKTGEGIND